MESTRRTPRLSISASTADDASASSLVACACALPRFPSAQRSLALPAAAGALLCHAVDVSQNIRAPHSLQCSTLAAMLQIWPG